MGAETEIVDENLYYGKRFTDKRFEKLHRQVLEYRKEVIANSNDYSEAQKKRYSEYIDMQLNTHIYGGILMSTSNIKLTSSLRSGFAILDFGNEDELQSFFKQY